MLKKLFILILLCGLGNVSQSQQLTRILFIFDASNSMNGKWEGATKIERAREILSNTIDDLEGIPNLEIALRVYGHQSPITPTFQDCEDTKLEVPFGPDNFKEVKFFINNVQPKGTTPIAKSLEAAADDFPDSESRNIIILITDGLEACSEFPCESARLLKEKGINVTPFVVGLGINLEYLNNFNCIGRTYEASTYESFQNVMKSVISDALLNTTVQINLNDLSSKPTETNVSVFLYEAGTKNLKYTFMHTLNQKGNPDTITVIDPDLKYDMVVNTLPRVETKNISIYRGQHNTIEADCPQGSIIARIKGPTKSPSVKVRITQKGESVTLNIQEMNEVQNYIVGTYDIEILTLPRIYMPNTKVNQSDYTYIEFPGSGLFKYKTFKPIVGQIFIKNDIGTYDWVCDLDQTKLYDQLYLQPGIYKVVYRYKDAVSTDYTNVKEFQIDSGENTIINL